MTPLHEYLLARLDRNHGVPMHRQLYLALRTAMQDGLLLQGQALPASRDLARALALARNTVLHAYDQLTAEGFLAARQGAGTFVAYQAEVPSGGISAALHADGLPGLSQRAAALLGDVGRRDDVDAPAFMPGLPDLAAFPWPVWHRLLQRRQRAAVPADADYRCDGGHPALKVALARYLGLSRGVRCLPDQVIVTGGMQQTLQLIGLALADAGDAVWVEEPGYTGTKAAWMAMGLQLVPVPVDAQGLDWQGGAYPAPRLVYVTPSHQYPLGAVMSLSRRQALLARAAEAGAWLVEDDYDSEFRHTGQPLAALQGLDTQGRVLYLGTFSKVMFPSLRLGYLVAPPSLVDPLRRLQARLCRESDYVVQAALADFIDEGYFTSHLRRMRAVYARRQAKLRAVLSFELGVDLSVSGAGGFALLGGSAGMHVTLRLPDGWDDVAISQALATEGIAAPPLSSYCLASPPFAGLVLGYAGVDDAGMLLAAVKLARCLRGLTPNGGLRQPLVPTIPSDNHGLA